MTKASSLKGQTIASFGDVQVSILNLNFASGGRENYPQATHMIHLDSLNVVPIKYIIKENKTRCHAIYMRWMIGWSGVGWEPWP